MREWIWNSSETCLDKYEVIFNFWIVSWFLLLSQRCPFWTTSAADFSREYKYNIWYIVVYISNHLYVISDLDTDMQRWSCQFCCVGVLYFILSDICITACIQHIRVCMYGRISKFSTKWINWSTNNEHLASMPHILQAWKDSNASTECKPTERTLIFSLCTPFFFLFALFLFSGGGDDAVQIGSSTYINCPSVSSVAKWMSLCMLFISVRSCVLHYNYSCVCLSMYAAHIHRKP